jgi:hypothetical protein
VTKIHEGAVIIVFNRAFFSMLTGGEIPHQPSEIPHQSLPFSPPVILPFFYQLHVKTVFIGHIKGH